jgi:hypothetical protein
MNGYSRTQKRCFDPQNSGSPSPPANALRSASAFLPPCLQRLRGRIYYRWREAGWSSSFRQEDEKEAGGAMSQHECFARSYCLNYQTIQKWRLRVAANQKLNPWCWAPVVPGWREVVMAEVRQTTSSLKTWREPKRITRLEGHISWAIRHELQVNHSRAHHQAHFDSAWEWRAVNLPVEKKIEGG